MHKRVEIIMRNPGYDGTEQALGSYAMDFEDAQAFEAARIELASKLSNMTGKPLVMMLKNEKGEELAVNLEYYVSHRVSDVADWIPTWVLPAEGAPAPPRESEP
jgi:hypothetical protein